MQIPQCNHSCFLLPQSSDAGGKLKEQHNTLGYKGPSLTGPPPTAFHSNSLDINIQGARVNLSQVFCAALEQAGPMQRTSQSFLGEESPVIATALLNHSSFCKGAASIGASFPMHS